MVQKPKKPQGDPGTENSYPEIKSSQSRNSLRSTVLQEPHDNRYFRCKRNPEFACNRPAISDTRTRPETRACTREGEDSAPRLLQIGLRQCVDHQPPSGSEAFGKANSESDAQLSQPATPRSGARAASAPVVFLEPFGDDAPDHVGSGGLLRLFQAQPVQGLDHGSWKANKYAMGVSRRPAQEDFST